MLNENQFNEWSNKLTLTPSAKELIQKIRSSEPSRRVQGGRSNVTGNYPSRKMGVTIQFESHRNELARIYELENSSDVLEYYDQPPPIEIIYQSLNGRKNRHSYTPDFFILGTNSAGWGECKTQQDLIKLSEKSPNRYTKGKEGKWHCPPAEAYAAKYDLCFWVWSDDEINWIYQDNFIWLEDYFYAKDTKIDLAVSKEVLAIVNAQEGITLKDLLLSITNISSAADISDVIYALIATNRLYVDLGVARLSDPGRVRVFSDQSIAFAYQHVIGNTNSTTNGITQIPITVGTLLLWDSEEWQVVNTGETKTGLLRNDNKFEELPNEIIENLIQQGRIAALNGVEHTNISDKRLEIMRRATPKDIAEATNRYEQIQPYLGRGALSTPSSTIRRWRSQYINAEETYGSGYIGLLPNHKGKGNRLPRLDENVMQFMVQFIKDNYETPKHRHSRGVYRSFVEVCEVHQPILTPPSYKTFCKVIESRKGLEQTMEREGRRAAIQKKPVYLQLKLTTPRHGSRPFEIVHIDHTPLDIELVSSTISLEQCSSHPNATARNLGKPWATFMVDAYSRRLLGVYLSYEEPSYRSCMMVLRVCVERFRRFPQSIVVDNGPEFHSNYFEQLLAYFICTKKHRPPAEARFGTVPERLFGTANTDFVHELTGNTQVNRLYRQVTKSINPKHLATWTLPDFYEALCHWAYEIYDNRQHPALDKSPREAFADGLAIGGSRLCRTVEDLELFRFLTLPAPKREQHKVHPGKGIKLGSIYYWSKTFLDPEIELSKVNIRYDPFDIGIAYALVRGQWVKCISNYYQDFQGRSEKEIRLISAELRKRKQNLGKDKSLTDKELAQFLRSAEAKEGVFLEQHLKTLDNRLILHKSGDLKSNFEPISESNSTLEEKKKNPSNWLETNEPFLQKAPPNKKEFPVEELKFYGDFDSWNPCERFIEE